MTAHLVDTNLLLRVIDRRQPLRPVARAAVATLLRQGHILHLAAQNCIEFWNVATRPADKNGLGVSPEYADRILRRIESRFAVLPDLPAVYPTWRQIAVSFNVAGVQVHDARLVAIMKTHGITHILTFNTADFIRYQSAGIVVVDPASI